MLFKETPELIRAVASELESEDKPLEDILSKKEQVEEDECESRTVEDNNKNS